MAVVSVRFNNEEEKMLNYLAAYYEKDKSSLLKQSLLELYEDLCDREVIADFEVAEKAGEVYFVSADELRRSLKK
jgi:predicted DNA-binding protein